jgi:hypothetical protein
MEIDKLVIAEGRIDPESSEPKLLVDTIKTDLKITTEVKQTPTPQPAAPQMSKPLPDKSAEISPPIDQAVAEVNPLRTPDSDAEATKVQESQPPYPSPTPEELPNEKPAVDGDWNDIDDAGLPPQPDRFPADWDLASAVMSAVADPEGAIDLAETAAEEESQLPTSISGAESSPGGQVSEASHETPPAVGSEITPEISSPLPPYIVSPLTSTESDAVQMITIILRSSLDKVRDNLRIRQIYGTLIAYPGQDRFAFHVFERGNGYLIEFPNFTTQVCPELLSRLKIFIPTDQLRVEEITFQ